MSTLCRSVTSSRNLLRACVEAQHPIDMDPFKSHFINPSVAAGEITGARAFVPTCVTSSGRLRATPPRAPKALLANRQTARQQEREDRPRQCVRTVSVSPESESHSPSSRQEPHRRRCAVLWSWLSHRKSKETRTGARTSPAHSASLWREVKYQSEGCKTLSAAESPSRKRPTEGALWFCKDRWMQRQQQNYKARNVIILVLWFNLQRCQPWGVYNEAGTSIFILNKNICSFLCHL